MSRMKDYLAIIYGGGDEAVEIAQQLMGLSDFTVQDEPRWVSVEDRLPREGEPVLAYWVPRKDGMACAMIRNLGGKFCWTPADQWTECDKPIAWMPLPEPPA